jgi:formamidopyrimidine-DNA glycosylase
VPELPDLEAYRHALEPRLVGRPLERLRLVSPFLLRSVEPPPGQLAGRRFAAVGRLGKRLVLELEGELFAVLHLMIAGRLRWLAPRAKGPGRIGLAAFELEEGALWVTEASKKKRAALHLVSGRPALAAHDPGGIEPLEASRAALRAALSRENRTLKRALTDPRMVAGIGNAYSDEILHAARLSPFARTGTLDEQGWTRLDAAVREVLGAWSARLIAEAGRGFPEKVTAFRAGMAVHGRFGLPCPRCGAPVQRIVYAENEANYCAACQTGGRLLADRALSRLLHDDWPKSLEELEERRGDHMGGGHAPSPRPAK